MPKKSYITFKDLRAFWDRKTDTIKLTSGDPELAARGWSLTLNRASRDEQILRDALVEAGIIPSEQASPQLSPPREPGDVIRNVPPHGRGERDADPENPMGIKYFPPFVPDRRGTEYDVIAEHNRKSDKGNWGYGEHPDEKSPLTDPNNIKFGQQISRDEGTLMNDALDGLRDKGLRCVEAGRQGAGDSESSPFLDEAGESRNVELGELLDAMLAMKGSDLHLSAGMPPLVRVSGILRALDQHAPLTAAKVKWLAYGVLNEDQRAVYEESAEIDAQFADAAGRKFRVNVFRDNRNVGAIFRYLDAGRGDGEGKSPRVPNPTRPQGPRSVPTPYRVPVPAQRWTDIQEEARRRMMQEGERAKGPAPVLPAVAKTSAFSTVLPPRTTASLSVLPPQAEYVSPSVNQDALQRARLHAAAEEAKRAAAQAPGLSGAQAVEFAEKQVSQLLNEPKTDPIIDPGKMSAADALTSIQEQLHQIIGLWEAEPPTTFTKQQLDLMRAGVDLKTYLETQGVKFSRTKGGWSASCPLHSEPNGRSFVIKTDAQTFRCHGCGRGGDIFTLVQELDDVSFKDAIIRVAAWLRAVAEGNPELGELGKMANQHLRVAVRRMAEELKDQDADDIPLAKAGEVPDEDEEPDPNEAYWETWRQEAAEAKKKYGGSYLGFRTRLSRDVVFFDPFRQIEENQGPACLITGSPGGGKSFLMFKMAYDLTLRGVATVYVDPKGDAIPLTTVPGMETSRLLHLRDSHEGILDPLQSIGAPGVDATVQQDLAMETITMLLGGHLNPTLTPHIRTVLNETIEDVIKDPGRTPMMNGILMKLLGHKDDRDGQLLLDLYKDLDRIARLPYGKLIFGVRKKKVDNTLLTKSLTVVTMLGLDLPGSGIAKEAFSLGNQLAVTVMYLLAARIREETIAYDKSAKKAILIDEVNVLAEMPQGQKMLLEIGRIGRSLNTSMLFASNNPRVFLDGPLLHMAATRFVFRTQGPENINASLNLLDLAKNNFNRQAVRNLMNGECMLLRTGGDVISVSIDVQNPALREAFDTDPNRRKKK